MTASNPGPARLGPRPLPLHLGLATGTWLSALPSLPLAKARHVPWREHQQSQAAQLTKAIDAADDAAFATALASEIGDRFAEMTAGIQAYWAHPYRRQPGSEAVVWSSGAARVVDYGASRGGGVPALFVPSLINRGYILDLAPDRSMLGYLGNTGVWPLLLDWGEPGAAEQAFDLDAYVNARLIPACAAVADLCGQTPVLVGYCMGGLLALAAAVQRPELVSRLVLLATPWDFHVDAPAVHLMARLGQRLGATWPLDQPVPVDMLQSFFAMLNPVRVANKFRAFGRLPPNSPQAVAFVQIEDWLNDGVPLAAPVARACFGQWYGENRPAGGCWCVGGEAIRPDRLTLSTLVVLPDRDRIVPPASARALADALPNPTVWSPNAGHIGMVAGARAKSGLWQPLAAWLKDS